MNTYEAVILLDNREVKKAWDQLKSNVDGLLTKHGAEIVVAKRWDERRLAYEIKKQRRATYYLNYFKADPQKISDIFHELKLSTSVLRSLILRVEEVPEEAFEPEKDFSLEALDDSSSRTTQASPAKESDKGETKESSEEAPEAAASKTEDAVAPAPAEGTPEADAPVATEEEKPEESPAEAPEATPAEASTAAPEEKESE